MMPLKDRPPVRPRTTSIIQDLNLLSNSNLSQEDRVSAVLDSAARQKVLELGAALNSPVHQALLALSREVWGLAQVVLGQPPQPPSSLKGKQPPVEE
jgi:hypothetical protein